MGGFVGTVLFDRHPPDFGDRWGRALAGLRARAPGEIHTAELSGPGFQARFAQLGHAAHTGQQGTLLLDAPPRVLAKVGQAVGSDTVLTLKGENFAAAWIDARAGSVRLWADRLASRSLVYTLADWGFTFASEIRGLAPFMDAVEPDPTTLNELFQFRWIVGRDSGIRNVARVPAVRKVLLARGHEPVEEPWEDIWRPYGGNDTLDQLVAATRAGITRALERVSTGRDTAVVLVSGGIDSALLASLAGRVFQRVVGLTARVAGFTNPELDRARDVAARLGIEHHVVDVDMEYAAEAFPRLVARLEAPPKHLNSMILMRLFEVARQYADIVLHGDCADATFGNASLQIALKLRQKQRMLQLLPRGVARWARTALQQSPRGRWRRLAGVMDTGREGVLRAVESVHYNLRVAPVRHDMYESTPGSDYVATSYPEKLADFGVWYATAHVYSFGAASWHRLERIASPLGLEICMPFLEPEVLTIGAAVPMRFRYIDGETKPVLKWLAGELIGDDVTAWPKQGFPSPEGAWLRGPLRHFIRRATRDDAWVRSWIDLDGVSDAELDSDELLMGTLAGLEEWYRQARLGFAGDALEP